MFAARGGFEYTAVSTSSGSFIATFNTTTAPATTIATSTGSNIYFVGSVSSNISIVKMDSVGAITWQKQIHGNTDIAKDAAIDSTGNLYVCGYTNNSGAGGNDGYLSKVDSAGNILWQRTIGTSYTSDSEVGVSVEPGDGNVFIAFSGNNTVNLARYSSAGTLGYQRQIDANADTAYDVVSTSGNAYIMGQGANDAFMTKINGSGTTQNSRKISQTGQTIVPVAVTADSTGNIILLSRRTGGNIVVSKHYSNTALIDSISFNSINGTTGGICVDSSDNIYVASSATSNIWYTKLYSGNLAIQWQREISTGNSTSSYNISWANNYVYITGRSQISGTFQALTSKLPADGTGQGIHGIYTIANAAYTTSSSSYTTATGANATTSTLTTGTPTLTVSNSSMTQTLTSF